MLFSIQGGCRTFGRSLWFFWPNLFSFWDQHLIFLSRDLPQPVRDAVVHRSRRQAEPQAMVVGSQGCLENPDIRVPMC